MSSRAFSGLYRMLSGFVALCLLSADLAGAASLIDFPQQEAIETPITVVVPPAEEQALFRTTVTLRQPRDLERIREMGAAVLEAGDTSALLLVTAPQLADLARLRFVPTASDELGVLVQAAGPSYEWLRAELQPALERAAEVSGQWSVVSDQTMDDGRQTTARAVELSALLAGVTAGQRAAIAALAATDSDNDGLTDTQEGWWCTNPANANSDGTGANDGAEVAALLNFTLSRAVRWGHGAPFGPPAAWPDFNGSDGNPTTPACNDGDYDTIPDFAEVFMVGSRVPEETTDLDKFDDGQELFGTTFCPGGTASCNYGSYPRIEYWNHIKASMPTWVQPPGDNLFVAAFPEPEVSVVPGSWTVERVTTITTAEGTMAETSNSYATTVMEGQGSSIADSVNWNNWEEVSQAVETPISALSPSVAPASAWNRVWGGAQLIGGIALTAGIAGVTCVTAGVVTLGAGCVAGVAVGGALGGALIGEGWADLTDPPDEKDPDPIQNNYYTTNRNTFNANTYNLDYGDENTYIAMNQPFDDQGIVRGLEGVQTAIVQQGNLMARGLTDISYQLSRPRLTETKTNGRSWGGAQTTTHEQYEEHSITNGQQFTTGQNWSTAWAVDSAHAADLRFTYKVDNTGTEYFRELSGLVFGIYLGDDATPLISYPAWQQFANGKIENFFPADAPKQFTSTLIPLTLEQMKRIDLGEKLTIVVEDFSYGADENFYQDAVNGGVEVLIEDGAADNDETVDRYVIPTWGVESVQDVLARAFPATEDAQGNLIALKTAEFNGTNPPVWNEYALSDIAWWNVYQSCATDCANVGATPLQAQMAQAGSSILFRFNRDSDRDGYKDNVEWRYGTDRNDPADHPFPEMLAGYTLTRAGNTVTGLLKLLNNGTFDAYGIDAVVYAPDDSITITNNTVGGNGRVRSGDSVAVGALIQPPNLSNMGNSTARVYAAGNYTGSADRVYTFTVQNDGVVGAGSTSMTWSDGAGGSGVVQLGSAYHPPLLIPVANGLHVGLDSGTLAAGASFTVQTLIPRDTFKFTINSEPYTPPVVVVSYSDPQGSHRFITPVQLGSLEDDLNAHTGQMLPGVGLSISANGPFNPSGDNATDFILNSPDAKPIESAKLYLDFVSDGKLVKEIVQTFDQQPGPTVRAATWSAASFNADYHPDGDNILLAFWTDAQDNIIDSAARPFNTFQDDPTAVLEVEAEYLSWDFGTVAKGTILKKSITIANTGRTELYVRPTPAGGLMMSPATLRVEPGGFATAELVLDTLALPVGAYADPVTLRTSDPAQPTVQVNASGTVDATANGVVAFSDDPYRPWDRVIRFTSAQAAGLATTFAHTITTDGNRATPLYYQDAGGARLGDGRDIAEWAGTTTELVQNGGFESGGGQFWPTGSGVWSIVTGHAHSGTYAAQPTQQSNQAPYIYQDIDLSNWRTWIDQGYGRAIWSNWLKTGAQAGNAKLAYYRSDSSEISSVDPGWVSTGGAWQQRVETLGIPIGATRVRITLKAQPATTDTGWIELLGPFTNNGGFENGNHGDWASRDGASFSISSDHPHTGSYYNSGTSYSGESHLWKDLSVSQYRTLIDAGYGTSDFEIYIWSKSDESYRARVEYFAGSTSLSDFDTGHIRQGHSQWTRVAAFDSRPIPVGTDRIRVSIYTKRYSGDKTDVDVDSVRFRVRFSNVPAASDTFFDDISFKLTPQYAAETKPGDSTVTVLTSPDAIAAGDSRRMQYGLKQQYAAAGDQTFNVRLPDHAYSSVTFEAMLRDPAGNPASTTIAVDVGANGSVDWQAPGLLIFPGTQTTDNLAAAVSAYMAAQPSGPDGMVDVPLKITLGGGGTLFLTNLRTTRGTSADGAIANADVTLTQTNLTEGDTTTVNATVRSNGAAIDGVTVGFFASLPNGLDWYLGSRYLPSVSPSGTATSLVWDTTGFTGATTVKVIIDPTNALAETNEGNNEATKSATVKTRPNLRPTAITPATSFPIAGETITVDVVVQNNGQTPSAAAVCSLYLGNPDSGGTLIGSQACGSLGANTAVTLTYPWTPGPAGPARLFARADSGQSLDEPDEFDNDRWLDLDVADPGPLPPNPPSNPSPADNATAVPVNTTLSWSGGDPNPGDPVTYEVFFGTANPPATKVTQSATSYDPPGDLTQGTTYYWQIVAKDNTNRTTTGPVWRFTTVNPTNNPPNTPSNPAPANNATNVALTTTVCWTGGDPDAGNTVTYDVYFGTISPPVTLASDNQSGTCYDPPGDLLAGMVYYWKIVAADNHSASTDGPIWQFTTANRAPNTPANPSPAHGATNLALTAALGWTGGDPDSGDVVTYDVYLGTTSPPTTLVSDNQASTTYDPPGDLSAGTLYYWKIIATDNHSASTDGPVWQFTTADGGDPPAAITLNPIADAYTAANYPTTNYGAATTVRVKDGSLPFYAFLKFDTSALGCVQIESATLRLYTTSPSAVANAVYAVDGNWNESTINWNNDPVLAGNSLDTVATFPLDTWVEYEVMAGVTLGGATSFGIKGNGADVVYFSSREGTQKPQLVIEYTSTGDTAPAAAFSADPLSGNAPLAVSFTDESTGCPTSYQWDFGDGASSTESNPTHAYTAPGPYEVSLTVGNAHGEDTETKTDYITVYDTPPEPDVYISPAGNVTLGGIPAAPADILRYDKTANQWTMVYDGSVRGTAKNITAFDIMDDGSVLLVFAAGQAIAGLGTATPYDVVKFTPNNPGVYPLGPGTYTWFFQGVVKGLSTLTEKIDALDFDAAGNRLLLSTVGATSVTLPGGTALKPADEDVFAFNRNTNQWQSPLVIDGSKMTGMAVEDINGLWYDPTTGDYIITIIGSFNLGGVKGTGKSVVKLTPNGGPTVFTPSIVPWLATGAVFGSTLDGLDLGD